MSDSFATPWNVARQAPLSVRFPRQEYWSVLPFPSPVDLPNPGVKPTSPALQVDSLPLSYREAAGIARSKKSNKCWQSCGETGALIHC